MSKDLELEVVVKLNNSNYLIGVKQMVQEVTKFQKQIEANRKMLEQIAKQKYEAKLNVSNTMAIKSVLETQKRLKELESQKAITLAAKDMAKDRIEKIKSTINEIIDKPKTIIVNALNKTKSVVAAIKDSITNIKKLASNIIFSGTSKMIFDNTIGSSMERERQEVAIKHFIRQANKSGNESKINDISDMYISLLKQNTNYGIDQVISSGREAIIIAEGNVQEAIELFKIAQDMAAVTPDSNLNEAMSALKDLKNGKASMMNKFNLDVNMPKQDIKNPSESKRIFKEVLNVQVKPFFEGGSESLSKSVIGQWSTTIGIMKNMGNDIGKKLLPPITEVFLKVNKHFNNFINSKHFKDIEKRVGELANKIGEKIVRWFTELESNPEKVKERFNQAKDTLEKFMDTLKKIGNCAKEMYETMKPLLKWIVENPKKSLAIYAGFKLGGGLLKLPSKIAQLKEDFGGLKVALGFLGKGKLGELKSGGGVLASIFKNNAIGGIASKLKNLSGASKNGIGVFKLWGSVIGNVVGKKAILPFINFFKVLLGNPVVPILMGIILALTLLHKAWKENWGGIQEIMAPVIDYIKDKYEKLKEFLKPITVGIEFAKKTIGSNNTIGDSDIVGNNALGTSYWKGGFTWVGEHGAELLKLPSGSEIVDNRNSMEFLGGNINIAKLSDQIIVREEADIDKITDAMVRKIKLAAVNS